MEGKYLSIPRVYALMSEYVSNNSIPYADRLTMFRAQSKLADNREFELKFNKEFSACKLKSVKDDYEYRLNNRIEIKLPLDFTLKPYLKTRWRLYQFDEIFLDGLDYKLAKRVAYDINVAFSIKYSDRNLSVTDV